MTLKPNIYKMKLATKRGMQIIMDSIKLINKPMEEIEIQKIFWNIFNKKPEWFKDENIIGEDFSWEKERCPIVLAGKNIAGDCHSVPSNNIFNKGDTCVFDFGVKLIFNDGDECCSDHQRVIYALKDDETEAPKDILYRFDVLRDAIQKGIDFIKVGVKGYEVDEIVRSHILSANFPDYQHGTGHPVDKVCHADGTLLSSLKRRPQEANMPIEDGRVYTIEPRIAIENGVSMEEMILVTNDYIMPLTDTQKQLIYVRLQ
jgi:Xaa-Pro aminopeptidase